MLCLGPSVVVELQAIEKSFCLPGIKSKVLDHVAYGLVSIQTDTDVSHLLIFFVWSENLMCRCVKAITDLCSAFPYSLHFVCEALALPPVVHTLHVR